MKKSRDLGIFKGDGREAIDPVSKFVSQGLRLTKGQARGVLDRFVVNGCSIHSRRSGTLWVVIEYCEANGFEYTIKAVPGLGYEVKSDDAKRTEDEKG